MWGALKSVSETLLYRSAVKMTHYRVTEEANCTKNCIQRNRPKDYVPAL